MKNKKYQTSIKIILDLVFYDNNYPEIKIVFSDKIIYEGMLTQKQEFEFNELLIENDYKLKIFFLNKKDCDTDLEKNKDKAVLIKNLIVNEIDCAECLYNGKYYPNYSAEYINTLKKNGERISTLLTGTTYLGWNGVWELNISVPGFIWLHRQKSLGWIFW